MENWINGALEGSNVTLGSPLYSKLKERDCGWKKDYFRDQTGGQPVPCHRQDELWGEAIEELRKFLAQIREPAFVQGLNAILPRYHAAQWINAVYL